MPSSDSQTATARVTPSLDGGLAPTRWRFASPRASPGGNRHCNADAACSPCSRVGWRASLRPGRHPATDELRRNVSAGMRGLIGARFAQTRPARNGDGVGRKGHHRRANDECVSGRGADATLWVGCRLRGRGWPCRDRDDCVKHLAGSRSHRVTAAAVGHPNDPRGARVVTRPVGRGMLAARGNRAEPRTPAVRLPPPGHRAKSGGFAPSDERMNAYGHGTQIAD